MKHLLSSTAFIVLNKELARQVGLKEAILLADLISKEQYFIDNGGITEGWFFNTEANIQADTTLTPYQQRKSITELKKHQLIEVKRMGIPAKQFFKINEELVVKFLNNLKSSNLTTINKNKEIKINNKYFKKPTVQDIDIYCSERQNKVDAFAFYDFYESKGWFVGKSKMKDWRAAVRNWERGDKKKPQKMSKLDSQLSQYEQAKKLL